MQSKTFDISSLQDNHLQLNPSDKPFSRDVFGETRRSYLNEFNLFADRFNSIPNFICEPRINCKNAHKWLLENFQSEIKDVHFIRLFSSKTNRTELDEVFYFLYDDLLIDIDIEASLIRFLFRKTPIDKVENIVSRIKKFRYRKSSTIPKIHLLINSWNGIETTKMDLIKPKLSIEENYNDDFKEIHQTIYKKLSKQNSKGLVLLHGKPGTGKTNYIRFLISKLKKDVIFFPPTMAINITDPSFMKILTENPNSIFIIEDAENIIIDRETNNGGSAVATLLNICDGLLSDCLNIQIICSFNTDISKVDSALLRKGRLIAKYDFKELSIEKAQQLSNKLKFNTIINRPMTLTEIYNQTEMEFKPKERNAIGFTSSYN